VGDAGRHPSTDPWFGFGRPTTPSTHRSSSIPGTDQVQLPQQLHRPAAPNRCHRSLALLVRNPRLCASLSGSSRRQSMGSERAYAAGAGGRHRSVSLVPGAGELDPCRSSTTSAGPASGAACCLSFPAGCSRSAMSRAGARPRPAWHALPAGPRAHPASSAHRGRQTLPAPT